MSYEPIALVIPVIYVALQYDALTRMEHSWKRTACGPLALMLVAFVIQVLLSIHDPMLAAWVPLVAMTGACVYLAGLTFLHQRAIRQAWEEEEAAIDAENVVYLNDFRTT